MKASRDNEITEKEMIQEVQRLLDELTKHAIGGKVTYMNFFDNTLTGWWDAYYDTNYEKRRQLKDIYNFQNFFEYQQSIRKASSDHPEIPAVPSCSAKVDKREVDEKKDFLEDVERDTTQIEKSLFQDAPAQSASDLGYGGLRCL
ncbi:hypothetical protein BO83DRAFT_431517 [Aspergillus eucalypticola CBS 122712]|uniref:Berberine/berberine-like domain-containing protein n=1 Tax=Aspergillus eucalypticola (strain CBS 122712 / IBT 29274) TaxID=1448314 RepID=A0A317UQI8_ASPEC|nr:uncharacterized protein BO83DRAFT_431517 [Aspergillus eucalypticola CBS 122712]PWY63835.1 hypothetical protein BO83DRAFT_431517 [Aspergillus eucalypticola CBS 122712]